MLVDCQGGGGGCCANSVAHGGNTSIALQGTGYSNMTKIESFVIV